MPIYEYICDACGKKFELIENFHSDSEKECQYCSGRAKRVVSQSSFVLKGTGWYLTDYAKKSSQGSDQKKDAQQGSKSKEGKPGSGDSSEKKSSSADTSKPTAKHNEK